MGKSIRGTETEKNLLKAFAGESQARNRYTYNGALAKKEGYVQIAQVFEETANHEKEHAKRFFKFLEGGDLEITAMYPAGKMGTTAENLLAAAMGEHEEHVELYPAFADVADKEGFPEVAEAFRAVAVSEKQHEKRFRGLLANLEAGTVFKKEQTVVWRCLNCGYLHEGAVAPDECPACIHPQDHFELLAENW